MVLVSVVLAVAAPAMRGFVQGRQIDDAARRIIALAADARSQAAARGVPFRMYVDAEQGVLWLAGADEPNHDADNSHDVLRLPKEVSVLFELPAQQPSPDVPVRLSQADAGVPYVMFYPNGRCDIATVELTDGLGQIRRLGTTVATERFALLDQE